MVGGLASAVAAAAFILLKQDLFYHENQGHVYFLVQQVREKVLGNLITRLLFVLFDFQL